jgi:D-alanyl-lipoteichoic acid acyltransferase DltB (MBOAT superfamily)
VLFNSLAYFVFFPIVVALHFATRPRFRWAVLLAASYLFYGWWKPSNLFFLLLSTSVDYGVGILLGRERRPGPRRALLIASLCANFGLLVLFKYLNFFSESAESLLRPLGVPIHVRAPDLVLPIGISFYTFQTVSYVIDVYRRQREPETHFGRFALFVAFFPHLVAGPIVRANKLLPQFRVEHRWDFDRTVSGLRWILWGLFKKVVIADRAASIVNAVYDHPERFQGATVVVATYAFAFQIYCDFSGYSDIAVGSARVLGIELTRNFDRPYGAATMPDFWRRWHISLSTWFRDYVYFPLGGSRVGWRRRAANLGIVFLLSGLWHGASWTFVVWGAFHGALMIATVGLAFAWRRTFGAVPVRPSLRAVARFGGVLLTFHLVCLGWVLFRARDLGHAWSVFSRVSDTVSVAYELTHIGPVPPDAMAVELAILLLSIVGLEIANAHIRAPVSERPRIPVPVRWLSWAALSVWVVLTASQTHSPFIYFQF